MTISGTISKFNKDPVLRGTVLVSGGLFAASIFSYILQVALGRILTIPDYGTFNALLSLSYLFMVPAHVISLSIIKVTSELKAKEDFSALTGLFWFLSRSALIIGIVVAITVFSLRSILGNYLRIEEVTVLSIYAVYLGASFLPMVPVAFLQGLLRFKGFAFYSVASSAIRLSLPLLFALLGYKIIGVYGGLAIYAITAFILAFSVLRKNLSTRDAEAVTGIVRRILSLSVSVLIIKISLDLLGNIDLILVKHFFDNHDAGIYASIVTICKVLLFGAGMIGTVMYPIISEQYTKGESILPTFKKFIIIQTVLIAGGVLTFVLFPELIAKIMFGDKFLASAQYIPLFSVFIAAYILINFFAMLCMAMGRTKVYIILVLGVILQFIGIQLFHGDIYTVIDVNLTAALVTLTLMIVYTAKILGHEKSIHNNTSI